MSSRMDKYNEETPAFRKRTERYSDLYYANGTEKYDKFDINSNVSVLKNDARKIDVDQIREMLDKKYRDNIPKRKSIAINIDDLPKAAENEDITKEYDINSILSKARNEKDVNYDYERLNKVNYDDLNIIDEVQNKYSDKSDADAFQEKELESLINTITALELKNKDTNKDADLLNLTDNDNTQLTKTINLAEHNTEKDEKFFTGKMEVKEKDYDDFGDIQKDIKSNSIVIKILIFLLILIVIAGVVFLINKYFKLGLF